MNIAYLISAHTDPQQLKRLIAALHPEAEYFVHIDRKSCLDDFTRLVPWPNVHFIPDRVDVVWGTMVEVTYQINLLRAAVEWPDKEFQHIFFLSGLDYPLLSPQVITRWLQERPGEEHLTAYCMDTPLLSEAQRTNYTVPRPWCRWRKGAAALRRLCKAAGLRKPLNFEVEGERWHLYKGSAWWCISQQLGAYILDRYDHTPAIRRYFADSFGPAETLIPTIVMNHPQWRGRCHEHKGEYPGLAALTPLHFIDYHPVIKVLDLTDYDRLVASGKLFCRKVVSGKSDTLVEKLRSRNG